MSVVQIGGVDHAFLPLRTIDITGTTAAETLPIIHTSGDSFFPLVDTSVWVFLKSNGENRGKLTNLALKSNFLPLVQSSTFIDFDNAAARGSYFDHFSVVNVGVGGGGSTPTPPPSTGVVYPVYR